MSSDGCLFPLLLTPPYPGTNIPPNPQSSREDGSASGLGLTLGVGWLGWKNVGSLTEEAQGSPYEAQHNCRVPARPGQPSPPPPHCPALWAEPPARLFHLPDSFSCLQPGKFMFGQKSISSVIPKLLFHFYSRMYNPEKK